MLRFLFKSASVVAQSQDHNEVCRIWDRTGWIKDQKGGIWDHSPGDQESQAMGSGSCSSLLRDQAVPLSLGDKEMWVQKLDQ